MPSTLTTLIFIYLSVIYYSILCSSTQIDFDPYHELGVATHATPKEIRKAYKKLALKFHPDRQKPSSNKNKMAKINNAFEILGDPKKKQSYDEEKIRNSHGFYRRGHSNSDGGIGAHLTSYNYYTLLYTPLDNKPWIIFAYEDFNQQCKKALTIYEDVCSKLRGIARCAKFNINKEKSLINEFNLRSVPHFIISYFDIHINKKIDKNVHWFYKHTNNYYRRQRTSSNFKSQDLVNAVSNVFHHQCQIIESVKDIKNKLFIDEENGNKVKSVIFSDNRIKPHVTFEYIANLYSLTIDFGYFYINNDGKGIFNEIVEELGLNWDEIETDTDSSVNAPSMYIFRSPSIYNILLNIIQRMDDENTSAFASTSITSNIEIFSDFLTLDNFGIYHLSLLGRNAEVENIHAFLNQYQMPLIPNIINAETFVNLCLLSNVERYAIDEQKICYIWMLNGNRAVINDKKMEEQVLILSHVILSKISDIVQFAWIDCQMQLQFCDRYSSNSSTNENGNGFELLAVHSYLDQFTIYENSKINDKNIDINDDQNLRNEEFLFNYNSIVNNILLWMKMIENGNEDEIENRDIYEIIWSEGILYPIDSDGKWFTAYASVSSTEIIDNIFGENNLIAVFFQMIFNFVSSVTTSVWSVVSYAFQFIFLLFILMFLLPLLRR